MKKTWYVVLLMAEAMVISACGTGNSGNSASSHQTSDSTLAADMGAVAINMQLSPSKKTTAKVTAAVVSGGGSGGGAISTPTDEQILRSMVHHVDFYFNGVNSFGQVQTLLVTDGLLEGKLQVAPGEYSMETYFTTKGGAVLYSSTKFVTVTSGMVTKVTPVLTKPPMIYIEGRINNPVGKLTDSSNYQVYINDIDPSGFSAATGGTYRAANNQLNITAVFPTNKINLQANIVYIDDNGTRQTAPFNFNLLKALTELDANGFVAFEWPPLGMVDVDFIFADDGKGFVKSDSITPIAQPAKGQNNTTIFKLSFENLTTDVAVIKKVIFRIWDTDYMSNMYLTRADLDLPPGISSTHFPCTITTDLGWGTAFMTCTTDIYTEAGQKVAVNLKGDVSANYPTTEMMNVQVIDGQVVTLTEQTVPFLGTTGLAFGPF